MNERNVMEWPKRARTAKFENGILILDSEKHFNVSELTMEIMEHLASYNLVGLHIKNYPNTSISDDGLMQAASILKLTHIQIDHTDVTYDGLMSITDNSKIVPVALEQFTKEQMEHFFNIQRQKAKKSIVLNEQDVEE